MIQTLTWHKCDELPDENAIILVEIDWDKCPRFELPYIVGRYFDGTMRCEDFNYSYKCAKRWAYLRE